MSHAYPEIFQGPRQSSPGSARSGEASPSRLRGQSGHHRELDRPGGIPGDWVALAPTGAEITTVTRWIDAGGAATGSTTFVGGLASPGSYVARTLSNNTYVLVSQSPALDVRSRRTWRGQRFAGLRLRAGLPGAGGAAAATAATRSTIALPDIVRL
jgi:hypothetical protein